VKIATVGHRAAYSGLIRSQKQNYSELIIVVFLQQLVPLHGN
jgi:hypothetical protein